MTRNPAFYGACALLLATAGCSQAATQAAEPEAAGVAAFAELGKPETTSDRAAYGIGLNLGKNLEAQEVEFDVRYLIRGLLDASGDGEALLSEEELVAAMQAFQSELAAKQRQAAAAAGARNRSDAEAFFASNGARPEVVTLPSGLQYEILTAGEGAKPAATDQVKAHYRGTLLDGTVFDSSYDRGTPATFPLDRVIAGWTEGLQLMGVGSKWKLYIPAELAYGSSPPPGSPISPGAALIFEVELLGIE